jgi:hypothetical protein
LSVTANTATTNTAAATSTKSLVVGGLTATAIAAVATTAVAGLGKLAGNSLAVNGAPIQLSGFAMLTVVFSGLGLILALVLARKAGRPRAAFVRTTLVLTALSLVPDLLVDAAVSTRLLLILAHLVAAAIVIPAIARRLHA